MLLTSKPMKQRQRFPLRLDALSHFDSIVTSLYITISTQFPLGILIVLTISKFTHKPANIESYSRSAIA
jgi:hypothetical protein